MTTKARRRAVAERAALVLGGGGHLGNAFVRALVDDGFRVTAVGRRTEPPANLSGLAIRYVAGDAESPGQIGEWLDGHQLIVDAAAPYLQDGASEATLLTRARRRMREVVDAATEARARLVYVSSFATLAAVHRDLLDQALAGAARASHPYFALKQEMERHVHAAIERGLEAVIVNPTLCLGPWDLKRRELCLVPMLLEREVPAILGHTVNVVDVRDVARLALAALSAGTFGRPLLASGHNIALADLCRMVCELGRTRPPGMRVPSAIGLAGAWLQSALAPSSMPETLLSVALVCQHRHIELGDEQRKLGALPRPLSQTVLDSVEWYRRAGYC